MNHFGIILNNNLKKNSFILLDNHLGKIESIAENRKNYKIIMNGALISYNIDKWKSLFILKDIELLLIPSVKGMGDIIFLHHILEICTYFIPINDSNHTQKVFNIIKNAYKKIENQESIMQKALLVKALFVALEIHPNEPFIKNNLKLWLTACINTHPFAHKMNTNFLNTLDNYE